MRVDIRRPAAKGCDVVAAMRGITRRAETRRGIQIVVAAMGRRISSSS